MNVIRRWRRRGQRLIDAVTQRNRQAKIYVETLKFSGGQSIGLNDSSILVVVGPNNAGKSSVLREIRDHLHEGARLGPVLEDAEIRVKGSASAFKKEVMEAGLATDKANFIRIDYSTYDVDKIDEEIKRGFIGSKIIPFFVSYLGAEERLKIADPSRRGEYFYSAPKTAMQWLELDEGVEQQISEIFERTFNVRLVLNTLAGENLVLHIVRKEDEKQELGTVREEAKWLASLPKLHRQGDGIRSFMGTIMSLLVHPTSTILLDEPEAFLHPPQARRLADVVANEVPSGCQVIVATHNDAFVRALLDTSENRVVLARIVRTGDVNRVTVLDQTQLNEMWSDPLLRTSDILSALFHDAAILCEGDSDARFYAALMDATRGEDRDLDVRFFHFGGKYRIASIARALKAVAVPVVVIVDIDMLSDREKFLTLFEAMGGARHDVEQDLQTIIRLVAERKGQMTGTELAVELKRLSNDVDGYKDVPREVKNKLMDLGRAPSNWARVKHDGFRALDVQVFHRISNACKLVGLLINPEGELEGFCRDVSRSRKSEWLAEAIRRDLSQDASVSDARAFAGEIRNAIKAATKRAI